jgi:hypothetical protein
MIASSTLFSILGTLPQDHGLSLNKRIDDCQHKWTHCAEWVTEAEQAEHQYDEGTLWQVDCWSFDRDGAHRLEGSMTPTHWMPLPTFVVDDMTDAAQDAMFHDAMDKDD